MKGSNSAMAQAISKVESVSGVDEVMDNYADIVVYFDHQHGVQELRAVWLENYRDDFEIVDSHTKGNPYMQLKA